MTHFVGDDRPQSRMRIARNAAELVLFGIREIPIRFDRDGVATTIRQAIACIYRALDAGSESLVQPEALAQAATLLGAARDALLKSARRRTFQIDRAADVLADARLHAQAACEAVAFDQMNRRMELPWGNTDGTARVEPFRASIGTPQLQTLSREAVEPVIDLGEAEPEPEPEVKVAVAKPPASIEQLRAMAKDLFAAANDTQAAEQEPASMDHETSTPHVPVTADDTERSVIAEIARDAIEDIASLGSLRHPIETESWLDQAPFEQRLLNRLDHFTSFGQDALRAAVLYHAESESPDESRAFALAFALGCVQGIDTVDAVVMTIRQSPPETYPGFIEGLVLATNPNVDGAMRVLLGTNDPELLALALEVLSRRRALTVEDLESTAGVHEPQIECLVARAIGTNLEQEQALERLERIYTTAESGSELHLTAIESGLRRCHPAARRELRGLLANPAADPTTARAAALLGLSGSARDLELVLGAAQLRAGPLALEGLGRLGHIHAMPCLLQIIDEQDEQSARVAARELERITGAGLIEEVEEPWVKELPPEAAEMDVPIPMKKVRRVTTDPERWHAWEREYGCRFDPMKKYRAGVLFAPSQLLAELEALEPRSDDRERAALEVCIATGHDFGFCSANWVVEQQRALRSLREYLERHRFEAGTWCFAGSSIAARPEPKREPMAAHIPSEPAHLPWEPSVVMLADPRAFRLPWERDATEETDPVEPEQPRVAEQVPVADPIEPAVPWVVHQIVAQDQTEPAVPWAPDQVVAKEQTEPAAPWVADEELIITDHQVSHSPLAFGAEGDTDAVADKSDSAAPPVAAQSRVPKNAGIVPDFLCEAHWGESTAGPIRFLSHGTPIARASPGRAGPSPRPVEPPRADGLPPPLPQTGTRLDPARLERETPEKKPPTPPPTHFELDPKDPAPPKSPLKKLPWEK